MLMAVICNARRSESEGEDLLCYQQPVAVMEEKCTHAPPTSRRSMLEPFPLAFGEKINSSKVSPAPRFVMTSAKKRT